MRRSIALVAAAALLVAAPTASGAEVPSLAPPPAEISTDGPTGRATAPLFAGGGTFVTTGLFFPGTAVFHDGEYVGEPYSIEKGTDIELINLDYGDLSNGHQIRSFATYKKGRKKGRPLFQSKRVSQPGQRALMLMGHLKPGVYDYRCTVHFGQYGLIEITK